MGPIRSLGASFAYAFVRSAAGIAAVYVVPKIIKAARRAPDGARFARRLLAQAEIRACARMVNWAQTRGCIAEARLDELRRRQP